VQAVLRLAIAQLNPNLNARLLMDVHGVETMFAPILVLYALHALHGLHNLNVLMQLPLANGAGITSAQTLLHSAQIVQITHPALALPLVAHGAVMVIARTRHAMLAVLLPMMINAKTLCKDAKFALLESALLLESAPHVNNSSQRKDAPIPPEVASGVPLQILAKLLETACLALHSLLRPVLVRQNARGVVMDRARTLLQSARNAQQFQVRLIANLHQSCVSGVAMVSAPQRITALHALLGLLSRIARTLVHH